MLRFPNLALGELESAVLEVLWTRGAMKPARVHAAVGRPDISVNTVSSALKRLSDKGLLTREKISHSYVYRTNITRSELQRQLIGAIAEQFGDSGGQGLLAAFVDIAEERGDDSLRNLERLIADRLVEDGDS
jgi:predicted transcriptional regulator